MYSAANIKLKISVLIFKNNIIASILITASLSSLTVGGKAIGKKFAIKHSEDIIFMVGKLLNKISLKKNK